MFSDCRRENSRNQGTASLLLTEIERNVFKRAPAHSADRERFRSARPDAGCTWTCHTADLRSRRSASPASASFRDLSVRSYSMLPKTTLLNANRSGTGGRALCRGRIHVPTLHRADEQLHRSLRAFLFVGVAHFLTAVVIPLLPTFIFNYDPTTEGRSRTSSGIDFLGCRPPAWRMHPEDGPHVRFHGP